MLSHFLYNAALILLANFPQRWPAVFTLAGNFRWQVVAGSGLLLAATLAGMTLLRPRPEQAVS
jgi:hypothetical protein